MPVTEIVWKTPSFHVNSKWHQHSRKLQFTTLAHHFSLLMLHTKLSSLSIWEMGNSSSVADQLGKPKARGCCCPRLTRRRFSRSGNTIMEYRRCAIKATYLSSYTHALKHNLFSWSDLCFLPSNPTIATQYQGGACTLHAT